MSVTITIATPTPGNKRRGQKGFLWCLQMQMRLQRCQMAAEWLIKLHFLHKYGSNVTKMTSAAKLTSLLKQTTVTKAKGQTKRRLLWFSFLLTNQIQLLNHFGLFSMTTQYLDNAGLTLQDRDRSPNVDWTLATKLSESAFQEEEGNTGNHQHHKVRDEEGACPHQEINRTSGIVISRKNYTVDGLNWSPPPFL